MSSIDLLVCTTCFGLTSAGQGMQRCQCEKYQAYPGVDCPSGFHLCFMCAASKAGGTSRWSWNACESCLKFNNRLKSKSGASLPLGRHSIMNGVSVPMNASKRIQEEKTEDLLHFVNVAEDISDWGKLQARILFESVPMWRNEPYIKLSVWEAKFELSTVKATTRSVNAFKQYLRIEEFPVLGGSDVSEE